MKRTQRLYSKSVARKKVLEDKHSLYIKNSSTTLTRHPPQAKNPNHAHTNAFIFLFFFPFPVLLSLSPFAFFFSFSHLLFSFSFSLFFSNTLSLLIRIMSHDVGFSTRQTLSSPLAHSLELPPIIQDTSMCLYR